MIDGLPYPLTSGRLRHAFFLRELVTRHEITLLALADPTVSGADLDAVRELVPDLEVFGPDRRGSRPYRALRRVVSDLGGPPHGALRDLRDRIREHAASGAFDAAIFHGRRSYPVARDARPIPIVADICDAASAHAWGRLAYTPPVERPRAFLRWAEVALLERRGMRAADHLVFATPRDRDALLGGPRRRASVIPNGVDPAYWSRSTPSRPPDTIAFTGAMDYPPNEDAALHLIRDILPVVRRRRPEARLLIVGRDPTQELVEAGNAPGVTVTGFVDDVRPFLDDATVFAAPIRFGAGIQNKVLEAMAMELPVVASPNAADGLRTDEGDVPPIAVATDTSMHAERIVDALEAALLDPSPVSANRRYVERHFVWAESARALEAAVERAIEHHARQARREAP